MKAFTETLVALILFSAMKVSKAALSLYKSVFAPSGYSNVMENFPLRMINGRLHVEGIPDAVKIIRIRSDSAKRLSNIALHRDDLGFADECLKVIESTPEMHRVTRQALWRGAIVHFYKCFGQNKAREASLDPSAIYGQDQLKQEVFEHFKALRHKHFVHDENSYAQSLPGAAINDGTKPYKIEKIVVSEVFGETLDQDAYCNVCLLVREAQKWVDCEFDRLCNDLTQELELWPYKKLAEQPEMTLVAPKVQDIRKRRED